MTIQAKTKGSLVTLECEGILAESDLDVLFKAFDEARRKGPFVVITDTTRMKSAPHKILGAFSDRLKKLPPLKNVWLGDAVVISSPSVRFIVSTLLMIAPLPTEVKVFELLPEAQRWCGEILRRANLDTSASHPW
jgi:hypothetical protein